MDQRQRKAVGFTILGLGAVVATGAAIALARRARPLDGGVVGRPTRKPKARGRTTRGGMTTTEYKGRLPIKERVAILQDLTHDSVKDPRMRKLALQITKHCPARDEKCEARAIYNWVRKNIRYTGDIGPHKLGRNGPVEAIDLFQTAARTVENQGGDCDDHSILFCTMALHNGFACRYRVTSPTRRKAEDYTHIYPMIGGGSKENPRRWVPADTTIPGEFFGQEVDYGKKIDFVA
jgi:transglutaminase-like putative cysteine protease